MKQASGGLFRGTSEISRKRAQPPHHNFAHNYVVTGTDYLLSFRGIRTSVGWVHSSEATSMKPGNYAHTHWSKRRMNLTKDLSTSLCGLQIVTAVSHNIFPIPPLILAPSNAQYTCQSSLIPSLSSPSPSQTVISTAGKLAPVRLVRKHMRSLKCHPRIIT